MSWRVQVEFQCDELDCESTARIWTEVRAELEQEHDSYGDVRTSVELEPAEYPEGWGWGFSATRYAHGVMCPRCIARQQPKKRTL